MFEEVPRHVRRTAPALHKHRRKRHLHRCALVRRPLLPARVEAASRLEQMRNVPLPVRAVVVPLRSHNVRHVTSSVARFRLPGARVQNIRNKMPVRLAARDRRAHRPLVVRRQLELVCPLKPSFAR